MVLAARRQERNAECSGGAARIWRRAMMTLYYCSRGYFRLRAALSAALQSPFLQAAALALLTIVAWDRFADSRSRGIDAAAAADLRPTPTLRTTAPRADERLLAWSILAARGSRGAAERAALEHLFHLGEPLDGLSFNGSELDLVGLDLASDEAPGASLRGVGFSGVTLRGATFERADLFSADFTGADLGGATLTYADLDRASFAGAELSAASLRRASLERAALDGATATAVDFRDVRAARSTAVGARLDGAFAMNGDWRGADFSRASLAHADFTGARVDHARFDGAEISGASFLGARGLETASFARAWAWADAPPTGLPETIRIDLCDRRRGEATRLALASTDRSDVVGSRRPETC